MTETAYCVKEKKKVTIKNPTKGTLKNNRSIIKGDCESCGSKVVKFIKKDSNTK